ncbi:hypothetical protein THRCLA_21060 [Thraustotheca clavata]|uniref:Reverse transcriptase domain-containing protein n=1 Tax=Thraustotheca clavata TaxID=74557 RepID=A0A1W0A0M2_9STRA|nr:hypothetical protein THRCLA_21060 [Thraustotheca clavata]
MSLSQPATIQPVTSSQNPTVFKRPSTNTGTMSETDFAPPSTALRRDFLQIVNKQLDPADHDSLDAPLTPEELAQAIKTMAPHKTPGIDGYPACFFQLAPMVFAEILCIVFNFHFQQGKLGPEQRLSAITLLYKSGDKLKPG